MGDLKTDNNRSLGEQPTDATNDPEGGSEAAEYVQELIRRMGGDPTSVPTQPEVPSEPIESIETNEVASDTANSFSMSLDDSVSEPETNVQKVVSKSRVVDSRDALMKFREAANLTTKDAFQKFTSKRLIERAYVWLFLTCFFLINTLMARYMGIGPNGVSGSVLHVSMGLAIAAGFRFVWLTYIVSRGSLHST